MGVVLLKKYATAQRKLLLAFFDEHQGQQFSVEEIAGELCRINNISLSSIYRNINDMVAKGSLQRVPGEGGRRFLYQYIGGGDCSRHLHLKCEKCGQLFHLDEQSMEGMLAFAASNNAFHINKKNILYGSCRSCT
jgi:Fur family ferric uptake transcriptional regulator